MSLRTAFAHLDGVVSAVEPATSAAEGFSCCSGAEADAELAGHRSCEWRIAAFSARESPTSGRRRARIVLRVRYEQAAFATPAAMELDVEDDVQALIDAITSTSARGKASETTIRGIAPVDESPGTEAITPQGATQPIARIVSIPFEIIHTRCSA